MLRDVFMPDIERSLLSNWKAFERSAVKFIDKNSSILYSLDMSTRYSFAEADRAILYDAMRIDVKQLKDEIKKSKDIASINKIMSNPFYDATILAMHVMVKNKRDKEALFLAIYASLNMYVSLHYGLFEFGANKNIMDYTIANLDNSYRIRQVKSIYGLLVDNAQVWFAKYKPKIARCDDADISALVFALWDRIKGKLAKLAHAYYDTKNSGKYLNYDSDSYSQDDFHVMDNDSYAIDRLATKAYLKLINHQFDSKFIRYSITRSDTSYSKLANIIDDIIADDDNNDVRKVITSIIEYYVVTCKKPPDTVARGEFISFMKKAYASNASLEQLDIVKSQIDKWLNENMYKYGKSKYANTAKLQYRKSIYMFFLFIINFEAKAGG